MAKCRKCGRSFDWEHGGGYAKMPDGTYLCSMNCELQEEIAKTNSLIKSLAMLAYDLEQAADDDGLSEERARNGSDCLYHTGRREVEESIASRVRSVIDNHEPARHNHVASDDGSDSCKRCGLDLRDEIHLRLSETAASP